MNKETPTTLPTMDELKIIFENNFDCYADNQGDVVMGMTFDAFQKVHQLTSAPLLKEIQLLKKDLLESIRVNSELEKERDELKALVDRLTTPAPKQP